MTCREWKRLIDVATAILFVSGMIKIVGVIMQIWMPDAILSSPETIA